MAPDVDKRVLQAYMALHFPLDHLLKSLGEQFRRGSSLLLCICSYQGGGIWARQYLSVALNIETFSYTTYFKIIEKKLSL